RRGKRIHVHAWLASYDPGSREGPVAAIFLKELGKGNLTLSGKYEIDGSPKCRDAGAHFSFAVRASQQSDALRMPVFYGAENRHTGCGLFKCSGASYDSRFTLTNSSCQLLNPINRYFLQVLH